MTNHNHGGSPSCCSYCCDSQNDDMHHHDNGHADFPSYIPIAVSSILLLVGLMFDHLIRPDFFNGLTRLGFYVIAYLPVGLPVLRQGWRSLKQGEVFTEFALMGIATLCAFFIGQYPEGVAVMLFYSIGEHFQYAAVNRAKSSIKALLDIRPDRARVRRNNLWIEVSPDEVEPGEVIQVLPGEKVALDGILIDTTSFFNTAALTGESVPRKISADERALAGMINQERPVEIRVTGRFADSALARILELVQNAVKTKAKPELFIRSFARIYTPVVTTLAVALAFVPWFFADHYVLNDWLYRACVFLVISCPCALVISIPLAYFGGIGVASRHGILFKGSAFLDLITKVDVVVMDKTGTVTKGVFQVQRIDSKRLPENEILFYAAALEQKSTHPAAKALCEYAVDRQISISAVSVSDVREIAGHGMEGRIANHEVLVGNLALLQKFGVNVPDDLLHNPGETVIYIAIDRSYAGTLTLSDSLKDDAQQAIISLRKQHIQKIILLSGDKNSVVQQVARNLDIDEAYGDLLPEDKTRHLQQLKDSNYKIIFVGDGINDAPALAVSDVGIAMGGLGSDAAIESADIIIQTDHPSKIATAISIGQKTRQILWQNITLAFVVKGAVLLLGAGGIATMWEAVFADIGVALLAILNVVRLQHIDFK